MLTAIIKDYRHLERSFNVSCLQSSPCTGIYVQTPGSKAWISLELFFLSLLINVWTIHTQISEYICMSILKANTIYMGLGDSLWCRNSASDNKTKRETMKKAVYSLHEADIKQKKPGFREAHWNTNEDARKLQCWLCFRKSGNNLNIYKNVERKIDLHDEMLCECLEPHKSKHKKKCWVKKKKWQNIIFDLTYSAT